MIVVIIIVIVLITIVIIVSPEVLFLAAEGSGGVKGAQPASGAGDQRVREGR